MLTNASEHASITKLEEELRKNGAFAPVIALIQASEERFAIDPSARGIEIVPLNVVKEAPNRCRMKLFRPREAEDRLCAFFFKRSNISFGRDRFSYGAVEFVPGRLREEEVHVWIDWLVSGLHPDRRPDQLRRAFLYTVPE